MAKQKIAPEETLDNAENLEVGKTQPTVDDQQQISGTLNEFITSILKRYPDHEFLYIDKQGGVFLEGTNQKLIGDAILYRNPFKQ